MIGTTAAIIGAGVIGAGASMAAANKGANAAEKAGELSYRATQDTIASNERMAAQIRADNEPYRQFGLQAAGALSNEFGFGGGGGPSMTGGSTYSYPGASYLPASAGPAGGGMGGYTSQAQQEAEYWDMVAQRNASAGVTYPTGPALASGGGGEAAGAPSMTGGQPGPFQWNADSAQAYLDRYPDAKANFLELQASGRTDALATDPAAFAQHHYYDDGARRDLPQRMAPPSMTGGPGGAKPGYNDPTVGGGGYQRPAAYAAPERMMTAAPNYNSREFMNSPDYKFGLESGQKALDNLTSANRGLMSGQRIKAAERYNQDYATTKFDNWRNFTAGQYRLDQNRNDLVYNADRAFGYGQQQDDLLYNAGRYDQRNNTLLTMAGFGVNANNANASAATNFANQNANLTMTGANARGNAAVQAANAWSGGVNNLLTTGAYLGGQYMSGGFGGGGSGGGSAAGGGSINSWLPGYGTPIRY